MMAVYNIMWMKRHGLKCGIAVGVVMVLLLFLKWPTQHNMEFISDPIRAQSVYNIPFQPVEEMDFPTVKGTTPRIPHILHQIFTTERIPVDYAPYIKSFLRFNPKWEYRFWTYASGRLLIQKAHPYLLKVYDSLGDSVMKADIIRIVVLYEYGGLYSDLDMEFLRPLDRVTMKYACIMSVAPCEISAFSKMPYMFLNGIMFSRPKHPFFKMLLDGLLGVSPKAYPGYATGPLYITRTFKKYNGITVDNENLTANTSMTNSPYFYKGGRPEDHIDGIYVPNSQYFMDNLGPTDNGTLTDLCTDAKKPTLSWLLRRACLEFVIRKDVRKRRTFTYTVHQWAALWTKSKDVIQNMKKVNIKEVAPSCILYS